MAYFGPKKVAQFGPNYPINELHDKTPVIITTNKSPKQWADVLKDTVLTTALLDRILHRCEIIKLEGSSYRMKHRKNIFDNEE